MEMNKMRSMLFCPASEPKLYINAPVFHPDCILLDLEDSVAYSEKDGARDLLCKAMKALDFGESKVFVRINSLHTPFGEEDVRAVVKAGARNIRLPMCESKEDVEGIDRLLAEVEKEEGLEEGAVKIQCSVETARGVMNARESAAASSRVISLSFGAEDYTNSMGISRTKSGRELAYARSYLPVAAAERGITAIDTVWTDLNDEDGFIEETKNAKELGFSGKSCIHPGQIKTVHKIFSPAQEEIDQAKKIIAAVAEAKRAGKGVFTVEGKMIDSPVIGKALRILSQAGMGGDEDALY